MPLVVALLPSSVARERFERALASCDLMQSVRFVESWSAFYTVLRNTTCSLMVVDPFQGNSIEAARLAALRSAFPSVSLMLYGRFHSHDWRTLLQLVHLRVQHVVAFDIDDDPRRLRLTLQGAMQDVRVEWLLTQLSDLIPSDLQHVVATLAREADERWSSSRIAAACGCHPKTLRAQLRSVGLPSTYRLVTWFRLFLAAQLLADRGRSVQQVANALQFPSTGAMREQMHRYLGRKPSDLRRGDALSLLLQRFRAECAVRSQAVAAVATNRRPVAGALRIPVSEELSTSHIEGGDQLSVLRGVEDGASSAPVLVEEPSGATPLHEWASARQSEGHSPTESERAHG